MLSFGSGETVIDRYTNAHMTSDSDSKKSTLGFLMTFSGELFLGNPSCRNV